MMEVNDAVRDTVVSRVAATITLGDIQLLKVSLVTFTSATLAASESPEVSYYDARGVVEGARYPTLAAVWENADDDAAFANL